MKIDIIETGIFRLDGGAMFGMIPKALWQRAYDPGDEFNRIPMAIRLMLITDGNRKILVDTGNGTKLPDKFCDIYGIDKKDADIEAAIARLGLSTDDITDVILTHLHFDHAGGATVLRDGKAVPTFRNATYYVQKEQFDWAVNPSVKDRASYMPHNYLPLKEHNQLKLIEGRFELFPGIEVIPVHGHTDAMQLVKVRIGKESILYCADLMATAAHVPVHYGMGYDNYPMKVIEEKQAILDEAFKENTILFFEHDAHKIATRLKHGPKGYSAAELVDITKL